MGGTVCSIIQPRDAPFPTLIDVASHLVGKVYHALMATDKSKPRKLIALKKARTTSLVKSPVLRHEACVLVRLRRRFFTTSDKVCCALNTRTYNDRSFKYSSGLCVGKIAMV